MCEKTDGNCETFDTIRQKFMRHLSSIGNDTIQTLSKKFGALDSNYERVNFVDNLLQKSRISLEFEDDSKNDRVSIKLREEGNQMFKIKKLKEAWEFYTKSISFAEDKSVNLGLAYANRSAVLFEIKLYEQCLEDIVRALDCNYPEHLITKLFARRNNCKNVDLSGLEVVKSAHEAVPTVINKNPSIQSASSSLAIQEQENWGRFVVATRDIKAGEVLAVEQPFTSLLISQYYSHCHECINLCYNLIPCQSCTKALYCSENCRNRAWQKYHKHECPILSTLRRLQLDKLKILPLKIAFLTINQKNFEQNDSYRSDSYKEIDDLIANTDKRSVSDLFERAFAASVIFNLVKDHTKFFQDNLNSENLFKERVLLHMQTGPSNFHEITELAPNSDNGYEPEEIASGVYAFLSLLNHSCCPNVTRFCYGSTLVLRAIEDIKKGEQCFDNYGYHYALMTRKERQTHLRDQYHFDCVCKACDNNWALLNDLPQFDDCQEQIDEELVVKLSKGDVKAADTILKSALPKLRYLQERQPCRNFCHVQEYVKHCLMMFGNKRKLF